MRWKIKVIFFCFLAPLILLLSCQEPTDSIFPKSFVKVDSLVYSNNTWVFVFAGQSNMAGRAKIEANDTVSSNRIFMLNENNEVVFAKEPLHNYEKDMLGLSSGLSFGKAMLNSVPNNISILLIPTAVGGSSILQWLGDSLHRGVKLLTNFQEKINVGKQYGEIKAIFWQQGETEALLNRTSNYGENLSLLLTSFRNISKIQNLPVFVGELGHFSKNVNFSIINQEIHQYAKKDSNTFIVQTNDLKHIGDELHFNSESQRIFGERLAYDFLNLAFKNQSFLKQ